LRLFSFGGNVLELAALALVVFGAIECPPHEPTHRQRGAPNGQPKRPRRRGSGRTTSNTHPSPGEQSAEEMFAYHPQGTRPIRE